jgi:hypothetical protein
MLSFRRTNPVVAPSRNPSFVALGAVRCVRRLQTVVPAEAGIHFWWLTVTVAFCDDRSGGGPAATHFSCFAKKSKQKKATPRSWQQRPPFGFLALLAVAGLSQNSGSWLCWGQIFRRCSPSNIARGLPPRLLRCSAAHTGLAQSQRPHEFTA